MKKIDINGQIYDIDCNALTYINYRKKFNRGIFEDIDVIQRFLTMQVLQTNQLKEKDPNISEAQIIKQLSNLMLKNLDDYIEAVTRIAYICCYTANENIGEYEDWLKSIKRINTNDPWIVEVTEFAVDCFC